LRYIIIEFEIPGIQNIGHFCFSGVDLRFEVKKQNNYAAEREAQIFWGYNL